MESCNCGSYIKASRHDETHKWKLLKTVCHVPAADKCGENFIFQQIKSNFIIEIRDGLIELRTDMNTIMRIEDDDLKADTKIRSQKIVKNKLE